MNKTNNPQFFAQGISNGFDLSNQTKGTISVVIAKPTRLCNADCSYCSSPPMGSNKADHEPKWTLDMFKFFFDKVFPYMINGGYWIWHGGEPMLMGSNFYLNAYEYARKKMESWF